ncbi:MAG: hypothetical protein M3N31_04250 [Actinomycetota bacterium]|nr:hypothetical protein [Actinomycetota bacterium]
MFSLAVRVATVAPATGMVADVPLALAWWRHPYPLHLRGLLWAMSAGVVVPPADCPSARPPPALHGLRRPDQ